VELADRGKEPAFEEVRDRFAEVLVAELVDNQCLSPIRYFFAKRVHF
jgi:hypothetical protein